MRIRTAVKHPKGGYVVTLDSGKQLLRKTFGEWFHLPSFKKPQFFSSYENVWDSHCARIRYADLAEKEKRLMAKAASTSRCPFCHEDVILAKESSVKCGPCAAVTHKACATECPDGCPTCRAPWSAAAPVQVFTQVGLSRGVREAVAASPPTPRRSFNEWLEQGSNSTYAAYALTAFAASFAALSFKLPEILKWVFG